MLSLPLLGDQMTEKEKLNEIKLKIITIMYDEELDIAQSSALIGSILAFLLDQSLAENFAANLLSFNSTFVRTYLLLNNKIKNAFNEKFEDYD